jgi:hypothetical protein
MQPDQPNNYWKQDPDDEESDKPTEMYTPAPVPDETPDTAPTEPPVRPALQQNTEKDLVHWSAVEYINGEKNGLWFTIFGIVVAALIAVDILFLHAYTFSALVIVMAIAVIVFTFRPARDIDYTLSGSQGLYVGEKLYHFGDFKSFGLIKDHGQHSIMLMPVKRFSLGVSVYFPEEVGEQIVDILGARLPMENLKLDVVDIIVQKLRL